jgi:hypothetical protein
VDTMPPESNLVTMAEMPITDETDVVEDPITEQAPKAEGLQRKWMVGEMLPWKGISFRVAAVEPAQIVLTPEAMTWQRAKKIKQNKSR